MADATSIYKRVMDKSFRAEIENRGQDGLVARAILMVACVIAEALRNSIEE